MQTNIKELEDYLSQKGAISVPDLTKMINSYIKKEYKVNEDQIRVISEVLDVDGSGFLEKREVLGVLGNLEYYTKVKSGEYTFVESLKSDWEKLAVKLKKMKEIWDEWSNSININFIYSLICFYFYLWEEFFSSMIIWWYFLEKICK